MKHGKTPKLHTALRAAALTRSRPSHQHSRRRRDRLQVRAPGRAPGRAADGDPRHHRREYRPAEPLPRPRHQRQLDQLDDHELLAHLRQPAPLRWPRSRPARTTPDVPDRPRHLHRVLVRLGHGGHRRCPVRRSGGPGSRGSDALPGCARDHHVRLPGHPAGEGSRRLGRSRRCWRRDRRPRRRRPDRVQRLAHDLLRQSPRRSRTRDRRAEDHPGRHSEAALEGSRPPRRRARNHESRRDRLRDHPGRGRRLDVRPDAPVRPRRPRRARCLRGSSSAAPTHRCSGSSGWPIALSAAASS